MVNKEKYIMQVPAYELPDSSFLGEESLESLAQYRAYFNLLMEQAAAAAASPVQQDAESVRKTQLEDFYNSANYKELRRRYPVELHDEAIGGVCCEVFTPSTGIPPENKSRVLINLHGGGFSGGDRTNSHSESAPVAALGKIKVISVDYRMAPEHRYPAATEDVMNVYTELLKEHAPHEIGIFGSSAGGVLTAQALARFRQDGLPKPAAIAMIAGAGSMRVGDSVAMITPLVKITMGIDMLSDRKAQYPYFADVSWSDPMVMPGESDDIMAWFPPSLLMSSTRDFSLSSVISSHRQLVRLNVQAELHIWEGLDHTFHYNPTLPESNELHRVTVDFFNKYLGKAGSQ